MKEKAVNASCICGLFVWFLVGGGGALIVTGY